MYGRNLCDCGENYYNPELYSSCYDCYLERREGYLSCIYCGRWHSERFDTCYQCRSTSSDQRIEAARNLRQYILWRDNYQCRECGTTEGLQVDHIKPCSHGGDASPWNLQTLCAPCNRHKGNTWNPNGPEQRRRRDLLEYYFYEGRGWLDTTQREALHRDALLIPENTTISIDEYVERYPRGHLLAPLQHKT